MKTILAFLLIPIICFGQNYTNWPTYVAPVAHQFSANVLLQSTNGDSFVNNIGAVDNQSGFSTNQTAKAGILGEFTNVLSTSIVGFSNAALSISAANGTNAFAIGQNLNISGGSSFSNNGGSIIISGGGSSGLVGGNVLIQPGLSDGVAFGTNIFGFDNFGIYPQNVFVGEQTIQGESDSLHPQQNIIAANGSTTNIIQICDSNNLPRILVNSNFSIVFANGQTSGGGLLVPNMTGSNAPSGYAYASSQSATAYQAFTNGTWTSDLEAAPSITYRFDSAVVVTGYVYTLSGVVTNKLEASMNGTDWTVITNAAGNDNGQLTPQLATEGIYFRFTFDDATPVTAAVSALNFYGYPLNSQVTMRGTNNNLRIDNNVDATGFSINGSPLATQSSVPVGANNTFAQIQVSGGSTGSNVNYNAVYQYDTSTVGLYTNTLGNGYAMVQLGVYPNYVFSNYVGNIANPYGTSAFLLVTNVASFVFPAVNYPGFYSLSLIGTNYHTTWNQSDAIQVTQYPTASGTTYTNFSGTIGAGGILGNGIDTNLSTAQLASAGVVTNIPSSSSLFVAINGDDSTAARGKPEKPWVNYNKAVTNSLQGDTIIVLPGTYSITNSLNGQTNGLSVVGYGRDISKTIQLNLSGGTGTHEVTYQGNNYFNGITISCTNDTFGRLGIPVFLDTAYVTSAIAVTNIFKDCTLSGGNDCVCFNSYEFDYDAPIHYEFWNTRFINGWDSLADFGSPYDTFGYSTNAVILFNGCSFEQDVARSTSNQNGDCHILNLYPFPNLTIQNCSGRFVGVRLGIYNPNNVNAVPYVLTNAILTMSDSHFDFVISTNNTLITSPTNYQVITPLDVSKFYNSKSTNIFVQNVSWTSNGVPFNLVYYSSPTNYMLVSARAVEVYSNGVLSAMSANGSALTSLNASQLTSGTVPDAQLSNNIARLNLNQTFSGTNIYSGMPVTNGVPTLIGANGAISIRQNSGSYWQFGNGNDVRFRLNGNTTAEYQEIEATRYNGKFGIAVSTAPGSVADDSSITSPSAGNWIIGAATGSGTPTMTGSLTSSNFFGVGTAAFTNGIVIPYLTPIGTGIPTNLIPSYAGTATNWWFGSYNGGVAYICTNLGAGTFTVKQVAP